MNSSDASANKNIATDDVRISLENADQETTALIDHPIFLAIIEHSRARHKKEGGISPEEMRQRLGLGDS